jgi:thioredoxin-dependent peroxiredoxin
MVLRFGERDQTFGAYLYFLFVEASVTHVYWMVALLFACQMVFCAEAPKVGDMAPDVGAPDETGKEIKLSSFKDKNAVVIFFYPKADTPGCTKESCGFRDDSKTYQEKGYVVLGASRDTPEAQKAFKEKYNLNYPLLSDPKGELATALGLTPGQRQTVVIGKDGKIEKIYKTVTAASHAQDVLKDLNANK